MKTANNLNTKSMYLESIIIEPCEEGGFFARYPLIQGCYAEGETYGEVIDNITAVIEGYIEIRKENKSLLNLNKTKSLPTFSINIPVFA